MSSVFKGSCIIFWLTWLICFTYLLGTIQFVHNYVIYDDLMEKYIRILDAVCYGAISLAFMGCFFLKCDISNVCCVFLFGIPTGLFLPCAAIYGFFEVASETDANPTPQEALELIRDNLLKYDETPNWLTQTEEEFKCCGIYGPQDYREIYRALGREKCLKFEYDIPCTCCLSAEVVEVGAINCVGEKKHKCMYNGSTEWMKHVAYTNSTDPLDLTLDDKCNLPNNTGFFIQTHRKVNNSNILEAQLNGKGCYTSLKTRYDMMTVCMKVFFIALLTCSLLMLAIYLRNVCNSSVITGVRSNYSLDVETLSLLNLTRNSDK